MKLRVILNAGGGTIRSQGPEAIRQQVADAFARHGATAELVLAEGGEVRHWAEEARAAAEAGRLDAIVIGGGDGSVGCVAGVLAGSGVPMGVLPLGTLNHFAKDLGMPLEIQEAVATIATATPRSVDVAEVNGRVFVNNSLVGIYPAMVRDRERWQHERHLGKWPAMTLAGLRMLWRFPRQQLRVCAAGSTTPYVTPCLFVGNNEYGVGLLTLGRRRLDQGELWLFVAKPRDPLTFLWLAGRLMASGLDQSGDFETLRVSEAEILTRARRILVATDGEVERMQPPLRYRTRPGALRVLAPAGN